MMKPMAESDIFLARVNKSLFSTLQNPINVLLTNPEVWLFTFQ